jgi:hypothetical protein
MSRMSENVGASTSRNPKGLHGLYREDFTFRNKHIICVEMHRKQTYLQIPKEMFLNVNNYNIAAAWILYLPNEHSQKLATKCLVINLELLLTTPDGPTLKYLK